MGRLSPPAPDRRRRLGPRLPARPGAPPSVQVRHVGVEAIDGDVLRLPGGRLRGLLEVPGSAVALPDGGQQEALHAGLAGCLNALAFPVQLLLRVQPAALDAPLGALERRLAREAAPGLAAAGRDLAALLRRLAAGESLLERRCYLVVPAPGAAAAPGPAARPPLLRRPRRPWGRGRAGAPLGGACPDRELVAPEADAAADPVAALDGRCAEVARELARCGLAARRLRGAEIARLLHAWWRPEGTVARGAPGHTLADRLAPAVVEAAPDHVRLERTYARVLAVTDLPRQVTPGWLAPLLAAGFPLDLSLHVEPLPAAGLVRTLSRRLAQLESARLLAERRGRLVDPEVAVAAEDVARLRDALQRGEARLFATALYLLLRAPSRPRLDDLTRRATHVLDGLLARGRVPRFVQDRALRACAPVGHDPLRQRHTLDTGSLAATVPVWAETASPPHAPDGPGPRAARAGDGPGPAGPAGIAGTAGQEGRPPPATRAVFWGVGRPGRTPVLLDPFAPELDNANVLLMATPGAGKSYAAKLLALRSLLAGVDVLVLDPEGEYRALCAAAAGQHVRLAAASPHRINPFDLPVPPPRGAPAGGGGALGAGTSGAGGPDPDPGPAGADPLAEQVVALVGLLETLVATPAAPLTADERAALDRALYRTYAGAGITGDSATWRRPAPLLADLHAVLAADAGAAGIAGAGAAGALAARLRRYVDGSLAGLFAGPTNVALDRRLVVFDVEALDPALRPAAIHLVAGLVWRELRRALRPRLLVVDEAWSVLQYPEGGAFLAGLARRARKRYLGLVTISQDVPEFLRSPHGQIVVRAAATKLLLKQDSTAADELAAALRLSPAERRLLLGAAKGEGLLLTQGAAGAARRPVQILAAAAEHALVTTAPAEVAARRPAGPPAVRRRLEPLPEEGVA